MERRLAAIMAADVAGYSRLMGADEAGTLARLKAVLTEVVEPTVAGRSGRIVKLMGDGVLAEFASVVDAVQCAADIQGAMTGRNAGEPGNHRIEYRIGVNLGDVIVDGDDIHGDGVNVAARLEALAEPGGVCISGKVHDELRGKLDVGFEDMGEQMLKNIAAAVRVFRIVPDASAASGSISVSGVLELPDRPSIAVLPFVNMSGDPEQEYFADGITEDIITQLSRFHELFVIARNSSFVYRGKAVDIREVGRDLGVRNVLEGSVRKSGERLRITAQLIDTTTGDHLWAEKYDRDLDDVFALQDEVAQTIVATLTERLEYIGAERASRKPPAEMAAYDFLLRGRVLFQRWDRECNSEARKMLEAALDIDTRYGEALAYLAMTHYADWLGSWSKAPHDTFLQFCDLAQRALALADTEAYPNVVMALAELYRRRHDEARFHVGKALDLNPNDADIIMSAGYIATFDGDHGEAVNRIDQATRVNPLGRYGLALALALFGARRYDEAIAALKTVRARLPHVQIIMAASYAHAGALNEAKIAALQLVETIRSDTAEVGAPAPKNWSAFITGRFPYRNREDLDHLLDGLRKAGLPE